MKLSCRLLLCMLACTLPNGYGYDPESLRAEEWTGLRASYFRDWGAFVYLMAGELERDRPADDVGGLVIAVAQGSAADEANLARGDWLVRAFDDKIIQKSGETESLLIEREGKRYSVEIALRDHPLDQQRFIRVKEAADGPRRFVVDREGGGDQRTIARALSLARPGDTVVVRTGLYREELVPPHGVVLQADDDAMVCVEAPNVVGVWGAENVVLRRLYLRCATSNGSPVKALFADGLRLEQLTISTEGTDPLVWLSRTNAAMIGDCSLHGARKETGVLLQESQADVRNNVIRQCKEGVHGNAKSRIKSYGNLLDGNLHGMRAFNSTLESVQDVVVGNGTDEGAGLVAVGSDALVRRSIVRRHNTGLSTVNAQGTVQDNVFAQCDTGVLVESGNVALRDNTIERNKGIGVILRSAEGAAGASVTTTIANNQIRFNAGTGITVRDHAASISQNVIEGNNFGIRLVQGPADVFRNTIVLQQGTGFCADAGAKGRVYNNIVAFGFVGMRIDRRAALERRSNVVYGNLGSKEPPLVDANYVREDRLPLSDGDRLAVLIFPAADLKAEGDLQVDPRFVKLGDDYRLAPDSPLLTAKGKDGLTIGAFSVDDPLLEFRDELPLRLSEFFPRFAVKSWSELEKRHVAEAFAEVRTSAPGLYARATAYGPIILWRERTPTRASSLATARWLYNAVSFPDAAFVDDPSQPLSGTLFHELAHLIDGDHRCERSAEFRELFEPRMERVRAAVERAGGEYFKRERTAAESAAAIRRFGELVRAEGMPSLYACTTPPEALAECVRATVEGETLPEPIREYVRTQFLNAPEKLDESMRRLRRALQLVFEDKPIEAEQVLTELIADTPSYAAAYFCRAQLRVLTRNWNGALDDYNRLVELSRDSPHHLAHAYADRHFAWKRQYRYDEALADLNEAVRLLPYEREFYWLRASVRSLRASKNLPEEVETLLSDLNRAIELAPYEAKLYSDRADAYYLKKQDYEQANADYTKAIELDPTDLDYVKNRGSMRLEAGRFSDALDDIEKCVAANPKDPFILFKRGRCREGMHDLARAVEDYTAAIKAWPLPVFEFHLRRGICLVQIGRYEEGIADLKRIGKNDEAAVWIRKAEVALKENR